jgi:TolB-like protein
VSARPPFLEELKRRKVVRVALMYGATAFAFLEAADILIPRLGIPDAAFQVLLGILAVGFPMALVVSWVYDRGPEGLERTPDADELPAGGGTGGSRWLSAGTVVAAVALVGAGLGVGWVAGSGTGSGDALPPGSIAVLPFQNLSADPDNAYFSDGLAEEIRNVLARVDGLRVAARTSAFQFRDAGQDVREIARVLGVASLLSGTVRREADQIRVSVELVGGADGFQIWSEGYDRQLRDVFQIQEDIARRVVAEIQPSVTRSKSLALPGSPPAGEGAVRVSRPTADAQAYEDFLRARYLFHQRTEASLEESIRLYDRALERDPDFVEARVGLAMVYTVIPGYSSRYKDIAWRRGFAEAERAVAQDSTQALAHAVLGNLSQASLDWDSALRSFRRARELAPTDATILLWSATLDLELGYLARGRASIERAAELDPGSGVITGWRGHLAYLDGEVDRALQLYEAASLRSWGPGEMWRCAVGRAHGRRGEVAQSCALVEGADGSPALPQGFAAGLAGDAAAFVRYAREVDTDDQPTLSTPLQYPYWSRLRPEMLQDPGVLAYLAERGLPAVWDAHGWPDRCRRTSGDAFTCG